MIHYPRPRHRADCSLQPGDEVGMVGTDLVGTVLRVNGSYPAEPGSGDRVYVDWRNGSSDNGDAEWIGVDLLAPLNATDVTEGAEADTR